MSGDDASAPDPSPGRTPLRARHVLAWVCLAAPFVALLWVAPYAKDGPHLWGFPFFFWYQFMWVFITALLTWFAYLLYAVRDGAPGTRPRARRGTHRGEPTP